MTGHVAGASASAEEQVDDPAAAVVRRPAAAVVEDLLPRTAGLFEGVGQDRQVAEAVLAVDDAGQLDHGGVVGRQPGGLEVYGAEGGRPEEVVQQGRLPGPLALPVGGQKVARGSAGVPGG